MFFVFFWRIFVLLNFIFVVECFAEPWEKTVVNFPIVKDNQLFVDVDEVKRALEVIDDKTVTWIIGKFKVGKSFIVDYIREDGIVTADKLVNTIGLTIWYNDREAVIDTEGMMQPIGENNPFFIKQFIISFLTRSADTIITVSNQMDLIDLDMHQRLNMVYSGSDISLKYHIHNCKDLDNDDLSKYYRRMKDYFGLNKYDEESSSKKPIIHLFVPMISGGIAGVIKSFFYGHDKTEIKFLGNKNYRRNALNLYNYMRATNDALLSIGAHEVIEFNEGSTSIQVDHLNLAVIPLWPYRSSWCIGSGIDQLLFRVEALSVESVTKTSESDITLKIGVLGNNFKVHYIEIPIQSPLNLVNHEKIPWEIASTGKGYFVMKISFAGDASKARVAKCNETDFSFHKLDVTSKEVSLYKVFLENVLWVLGMAKEQGQVLTRWISQPEEPVPDIEL